MTSLDLVLADDRAAFVKAARPLLDDPAALEALVPDLLRETALRHYRERYPKHVPHALLTLLGGLDARDLLDAPDRPLPLVQALSYVCREKHSTPFPIADLPAVSRKLLAALARRLREGDERVYG